MNRLRMLLSPWLVLALLLSACGATTPAADAPAATVAQPTAAADAPAAATTAPTAAPTTATTGATIKAVTTMSILADMITQVGGDRVTAENIIPTGAGPEDYQPTPQDAQKIAAADIVFFNGHGLEGWLSDLFTSAGKPGLPQVDLSKDLAAVDVGSENFTEGNPHFWMSAAYGMQYVEQIRDSLAQLDPAGKETYTANAATYLTQLATLNDELKQLANTLPENARKMVTNHDAFPYFAKEYGFTIVGNILGNPEAEPAAGDLAVLVQAIKDQQVKAIFSESQFNPKLAQTISQEAGITINADLYTDTLGDAQSGVTSYVEMLRYDMKTIVDALK